MWNVFSGTIVNAIAVAVGSLAGLTVAKSLPERYRTIVLQCLGLMTITLAVDAGVLGFAATVGKYRQGVSHPETYGARLAMVVIGSLIVGAVIGTALRLQERIEETGVWIHRRFARGDSGRFAEGFLTASIIFCVGPLTLMGCLENGGRGNPSFLYIKSVLDGFCSLALASSLGWGVFASVLTVIVFQGGLSAVAYLTLNTAASNSAIQPLHPLSVELMSAVGGIVLLATSFLILDLKRMAVANMLPGFFLPPVVVWLAQHFAPGWLLPLA
jgi:uncharacterized membrane protein YqgA involved in biofilm formation